MELLVSSKGGRKLDYNGYLYTTAATRKSKIWWKCSQKVSLGNRLAHVFIFIFLWQVHILKISMTNTSALGDIPQSMLILVGNHNFAMGIPYFLCNFKLIYEVNVDQNINSNASWNMSWIEFISHACRLGLIHDDVIKWKHFLRNWPFVRGIHRSRWIPHTKG